MDLLVEAEIRNAAARPGCLLCRISEEAALRYLRSVLHEGVNDGATRTRLDRSWGFCRRHAWHFLGLEWQTMHDSLSTATLSEGLVEAAEGPLDIFLAAAAPRSQRREAARAPFESLAKKLAPAERCPACQVQTEHERYAATVLMTKLEDSGWREMLTRSGGLCLPHFRGAIAGDASPERARWLVEDQRRRLAELRSDLVEYGRKHDYRFSQERYGREADVATRATEALAGNWFELPRPPRASLEPEGPVAQVKEDSNHG